MFLTDSIYVIGYNHTVCEDYAYSGEVSNPNGDIPYAIICDGCSGSINTDIGSRLLAHGFMNFLRKIGNSIHYYHKEPDELYNDLCYHLKRTIHNSAETVGLSSDSFVATIRAMVIIKDKLFCFHFGDGYTIHQNEIRKYITHTEFTSNAPYYFKNHIDKREQKNYVDFYENDIISYNGFNIENPEYYVNSKKHFYEVVNLNELSIGQHLFTVVSDGIDTFYKVDEQGKQIKIPTEEIMDRAFNFKNYRGVFIKRRFNKFFKEIEKEEIRHYDDLSVASILYDKKEEI